MRIDEPLNSITDGDCIHILSVQGEKMTKPKPKNTELHKGQWVELPSGAIVCIRKIFEIRTVTQVAEVRTLNADGAMANGSMELSLDFLLRIGKVLALDENTDEAA